MDTTSSAGDWSGIVVFEHKGKFAIVPFWQVNNYPARGYTLHTAKPLVILNSEPDMDLIEEYYMYFCEL